MASSSRAPCVDDFSSFVNAEFDRYKLATRQAVSEMLVHIMKTSRFTEKVVLDDFDNELPENRVDPQQQSMGTSAMHAIAKCKENTEKLSRYSTEEDTATLQFKKPFKCFQIESANMMPKAFKDAQTKVLATAPIELTAMRWRDESELLDLGTELVGPRGKIIMKVEHVLSIKDFLMKELPKNRLCCRTHFGKCFAKVLKGKMKKHCHDTGVRKHLKRTNHCLGFAYMEEDRPFMSQVLEELIQDMALENHHEAHKIKDKKKQLQEFAISDDEMETQGE